MLYKNKFIKMHLSIAFNDVPNSQRVMIYLANMLGFLFSRVDCVVVETWYLTEH